MTCPTLDRPQVRSPLVGWTIPCLLLLVACGDSPSPRPPLVEGERLGTAEHEDVRLLASLTCTREPIGPASLRFADLLPAVVQVDLTLFTATGGAAGRVAPDASFRS